ncbi:Teichoic acids export ATP-binding protein TagH [Roseimaritima multifibrata]|uniref:Teichoic acids export ATP-binding protein TagH n=1 Tax=Roseimaritima multifibrata TaxID=1930274 RepID=A0A517MNA8_9BACT|nr:ABC transporter ATP-binding protein [Roseimaritima multifibrata]QDS96360.1 Teichoic acids export ATP-binding protein TagH [Roseimaritima multifibrata]
MSDKDILVRAENVSKKFCRDLKKSLWYGVKDSAKDLVGGASISDSTSVSLREGEFWANQGITFEVKRGQCLGLIGGNGAGKTTLLKMLNGLIKPDVGVIQMRGRVGALIALGAGFNPVLTGRENVYVNGSILGMSKRETSNRLDEIVEFAGLRDFIDTPVKNYSSGMQVRLGFSTAVILMHPDVLILDEVLAVGDVGFRNRCYKKISSLMSNAAVILVSHSMENISQCANSVGVMQKGRFELFGEVSVGVEAYNRAVAQDHQGCSVSSKDAKSLQYPVSSAEVILESSVVEYGGELKVRVLLNTQDVFAGAEMFFTAFDVSQRPVMCWSSTRNGIEFELLEGTQEILFSVEPLHLHDGVYSWSLVIGRRKTIDRPVSISAGGNFEVLSGARPLNSAPYLPLAKCFKVSPLSV